MVKAGPGYPIPSQEINESWKEEANQTRYIGMQAEEGDLAIFLKSKSHEIEFEHQKYIIIPHGAILLLVRDDIEM